MHKIFLTEPEVSFIKGADAIVKELGGFPSMENGKLVEISVRNGLSYSRYNVSLVFDIEEWGRASSRYMNIPKPQNMYIQMEFLNVRDVFISSPSINECGEFKFGNTLDREKMYQDDLPSRPIIVERPFCTFYMQAGRDFVLEFDDSDCLVLALFLKERKRASCSLLETLERDKELRESGELQEIMSRSVLSQGSRIDAQFLEEASEAHQKAEEDGTLYERTRPRAGMRSGEPIKSLEGVPLPEEPEMFLGSLPSEMPDRFRNAKRL